MNCNAFSRKSQAYEELLKKPYWHLFEAAEYVSGITNLDMFDFLPKLLEEIFHLGQIPVGSLAFNEGEEREDICIDNYDCILRIIYDSIQKKEIESHPIQMTFFGRSTSIEDEFPHLKSHTYLIRPLETLYLLVTEGIILPKELQSVLQISQVSNPEALTKGSLNSLKRDAVSQVIRFENPKDNLKTHTERLKKLKAILETDRSIGKFLQNQKVRSKEYKPLWRQDFKNLSLALHFLHTDTCTRAAIAFSNTKAETHGHLPCIPSIMQHQDEQVVVFDFSRMKEALRIVSLLLLLKYTNMTSHDLLNHPLIRMYGLAGGNSTMAIIKFILRDHLESLDFFASSSVPTIL